MAQELGGMVFKNKHRIVTAACNEPRMFAYILNAHALAEELTDLLRAGTVFAVYIPLQLKGYISSEGN